MATVALMTDLVLTSMKDGPKLLSNHIHIVESRGDPKEYYKRSTDVIKTLQDQIFDFEKKIVLAKVIIRYYRF